MLNNVILMGRITKDLELKQTQSGISVLQFGIAVDRSYAKQGEERQADFISCVAWRSTAEFISKYFAKGRMIAIEGNLRTRTYDDNKGSRHYVTEVYVDSVSFTGEPKQSSSNGVTPYNPVPDEPPVSISDMPDMNDFEEVLSDNVPPF